MEFLYQDISGSQCSSVMVSVILEMYSAAVDTPHMQSAARCSVVHSDGQGNSCASFLDLHGGFII